LQALSLKKQTGPQPGLWISLMQPMDQFRSARAGRDDDVVPPRPLLEPAALLPLL
jgi:hypothetical protein